MEKSSREVEEKVGGLMDELMGGLMGGLMGRLMVGTDGAKPLSTAPCVLDFVAYVGVLRGKGFNAPKHAW